MYLFYRGYGAFQPTATEEPFLACAPPPLPASPEQYKKIVTPVQAMPTNANVFDKNIDWDFRYHQEPDYNCLDSFLQSSTPPTSPETPVKKKAPRPKRAETCRRYQKGRCRDGTVLLQKRHIFTFFVVFYMFCCIKRCEEVCVYAPAMWDLWG